MSENININQLEMDVLKKVLFAVKDNLNQDLDGSFWENQTTWSLHLSNDEFLSLVKVSQLLILCEG